MYIRYTRNFCPIGTYKIAKKGGRALVAKRGGGVVNQAPMSANEQSLTSWPTFWQMQYQGG